MEIQTEAARLAKKNIQENGLENRLRFQSGDLRLREELPPAGSFDLVVCNPPFHSEAAITTAASDVMFIEAARVLKPGGVMLTVFNSHLPHRRALERMVGPTVQLGRNAKFTVTRSVRGSLG